MQDNYNFDSVLDDFNNMLSEIEIFCGLNTPLYHYTTLNGLKGIIDSQSLHLSKINVLNDKKEVSYFHELVKILIEEFERVGNDDIGKLECYFRYLTKILDNKEKELEKPTPPYWRKDGDSYLFSRDIFVCSFSRDDDLLDMWNYYAEGDGVCIKLCLEHEKGIERKVDVYEIGNTPLTSVQCDKYVGCVVYDLATQKQMIKNILIKGAESFEKFCDSDYVENVIMYWMNVFYRTILFPMSLFMKHPAFCNEREIRVAITKRYTMSNEDEWIKLAYEGKYKNRYKVVGDVVKPYIEMKLSKNDICQVSVGPLSKLDRRNLYEYLNSEGLNLTMNDIKKSTIPLR